MFVLHVTYTQTQNPHFMYFLKFLVLTDRKNLLVGLLVSWINTRTMFIWYRGSQPFMDN